MMKKVLKIFEQEVKQAVREAEEKVTNDIAINLAKDSVLTIEQIETITKVSRSKFEMYYGKKDNE
ncbi:hypothetical protein [Fictibacillus phosphorivorans]|jgi:hypothetical protein|uniref:hypothetical protein n=1 Tax=Fictibacillus phosphorivorans TaxID=1221500 RepID=UPI0012C22012|nr:hypothetical protein [Fictibacillus phosphorivorans]MQR93708.1 hypothetical protein [Fictibacillus phosphorivorans]